MQNKKSKVTMKKAVKKKPAKRLTVVGDTTEYFFKHNAKKRLTHAIKDFESKQLESTKNPLPKEPHTICSTFFLEQNVNGKWIDARHLSIPSNEAVKAFESRIASSIKYKQTRYIRWFIYATALLGLIIMLMY